jgi:hypothetical protein
VGREEGHILINSWYFDFKNMTAYRDPEYLLKYPWANLPGSRIEFSLHIRGNGEIGKQHKHELIKIFDEPEDGFNDIIDEAFLSYTIEEQILLSTLSESNT